MKVLVSLLFVLLLVVFSCKKDRFTTEPQVTVKSISPGEVFQGAVITLQAKFTDDEGDIDSAFVIKKYYDGENVTFTDTSISLLAGLGVPDKTREGNMYVRYLYGVIDQNSPYPLLLGSPVPEDTTATLGLILADKAGHRSAYSESGKIRLKKTP